MRGKTFLIVIAAVSLLVFLGWLVQRRMERMPRAGAPLTLDTLLGRNAPPPSFQPPDLDGSGLPVLSQGMPAFDGIQAWLNSEALTPEALRGKVVLVDFWTYSCINCIRTFPYVTSWHEKYKEKGFTVVGMHTPEFAFEKEEKNVRRAIARHGITYPVALDNAYATWTNFSNRYWPAHYLFDAEGRLRYYHFGEGHYEETERAIQALLKEAGQNAAMPVTEAGQAPDFRKIGTPETYLGYERMEHLGSPESVARDRERRYTATSVLAPNAFYFDGPWTVEAERAIAGGNARLLYRYDAAVANLVMSSDGAKRVEVVLDDKPVPEGLRGADVRADASGATYVEVDDERLYELVNARGTYAPHLLELRFIDPGTAAYAFTFG